jgi:hypothetical protein
MTTVTFNHQYNADGSIVYGLRSDGIFVVSGASGPELLGKPGILLLNGTTLYYHDDGSIGYS